MDKRRVQFMWDEGLTFKQMADQLGVTEPTLVNQIDRWRKSGDDSFPLRGHGRRPPSAVAETCLIRFDPEQAALFHEAAKARNCSAKRLALDLIAAIIEDDMFAAVLDDGVTTPEGAA